jgi:hypothetical protein
MEERKILGVEVLRHAALFEDTASVLDVLLDSPEVESNHRFFFYRRLIKTLLY